jgi:integrase
MESLWRSARCDVSTPRSMPHWPKHNAGPGSLRMSPTTQLRPEMNRLRCGLPPRYRWHSFSSSLLATRHLHLYLTLAAMTGARRGQLLALRWIDVDLEEGGLSIQRSLVEGPDGPLLVPTKTRRSYRVALDAASLELLRGHRQATSTGGGAMAPENRFVFSFDEAGTRPWSPNFVTKRFIKVRRAAGIDHFRLHDLRHFMATQMLDAGVPIPIVAARLCHARASTTLNVYAHAVPGGDRRAAETLWQRVDRAGSALSSSFDE